MVNIHRLIIKHIKYKAMVNKYKNMDITFHNNDIIRIEGHYQYKIKGDLVKKILNLAYKVAAPPNCKMSIETFIGGFMNKILKEGILNLQSNCVCWKKIVLKTQNNSFSYLLSEAVKGTINKPPKADASYQFGIQIGDSSVVILKLSGVPDHIPPDNVYTCEELLIIPLEFTESNVILSVCGIKPVAENLNITGKKIVTNSPKKIESTANRRNGRMYINSK